MNRPVEPNFNPPPLGDKSGGSNDGGRRFVTWRGFTTFAAAALLVGGLATYLHGEFKSIHREISEVRTAVHENARKLAVVETEIVGLRRDVEGLKVEVKSLKEHASMDHALDGTDLSMARIAP